MITKMLIIGFGLAAAISIAGNKYNEKIPVQSVKEMPIVSTWDKGYVQVIEREIGDESMKASTLSGPTRHAMLLRTGKLQTAKLQTAKLQ